MRKVSYKKGKNGEEISDDEMGEVPNDSMNNGDEEAKVSKSTGKRGRPRKNPAAPFETHTQKSKRGRKPKSIKIYDIEPDSSKIRLETNFNDSEEDDDSAKIYDEMDDDRNNHRFDSNVGPIESMFNNYMPDNKFIPSKPPQFQSPMTALGLTRSPAPDFRSQANGFHLQAMKPMNQSPDDNPIQKKLNEIIAQSFNNWNSEPKNKSNKRKDTLIDFDGQMYSGFNPNLDRKGGNSIMSPDYKLRSNSINSNGWNLHKPSFDFGGRLSIDDYNHRFNLDEEKKPNNNHNQPNNNHNQPKEHKNELLEILKKNHNINISKIARKSTMIDNPVNTLKQSSPLNFPKFSAAFKPYKKRAQSFHISPVVTSLTTEPIKTAGPLESIMVSIIPDRKRDIKAESKHDD